MCAARDGSTERETFRMSMTQDEINQAEMMLSLDCGPDGNPLTPEMRAAIEAELAENKTQQPSPSAQQQPAAPQDIQALIAAEVARQTGGAPTGQAAPQGGTFADILKRIDPRDSDAALAMFEWLVDNQRLSRIGMLDGGGYLLHYSEPKGSSKQGYTPGATQGGRMVDNAVAEARAAGATPRKTGICDQCWSAVVQQDDGTIVTDDESKTAACSSGGPHTFNA